MIAEQRQHKDGVTIQSPISKKSIKQVGILYVDVINICANLSKDEYLEEVSVKAHEGIDQWVNSPIAVRGVLNPIKYSWTTHDIFPGRMVHGNTETE